MKFIKKIITFIIVLVIAYFLFNWMQQQNETKVTQTTVSVVQQLQQIRKLETAEMVITKIMEWEEQLTDLVPRVWLDNLINDFLFKNKVVFEVEWKIVAWFDMQKLATWAIEAYQDGSVKIQLPPAELLHVELTEWTKPFARELWLLTKWDPQMETKIRNQAKEMLKEDAINAGILKHAEQSAQKTLTDLLWSAGISVVEVTIQQL